MVGREFACFIVADEYFSGEECGEREISHIFRGFFFKVEAGDKAI